MRGFFEIGIDHCKFPENLGTLWRSAYQLGAAGIFTVSQKWTPDSPDTLKAWRHVPLRCWPDMQHLVDALPFSTVLVGIEMEGIPLREFKHPLRACYVLGSEDHGLTNAAREACHELVSLEAIRTLSYNVAVAGSIVMYHRMTMLTAVV